MKQQVNLHELPVYFIHRQVEKPRAVKSVRNTVSPNTSPFLEHQPPPKRLNAVLMLLIGLFLIYFGVIFYFAFPFKINHSVDSHEHDVRILYNLVDIQNKTIDTLVRKVKRIPYLLSYQQKDSNSKKNDDDAAILLHQKQIRDKYLTLPEKECESRYGLQIVSEWKAKEEVWCKSNVNSPAKSSSLKCYPYQQKHRSEKGKGKDVFCVAENFILDFSLIYGDVAPDGVKLFNQLAYLDLLMNDAMQSSCQRTPEYNLDMFAPHANNYFTNFKDNIENPDFQVYEETTTYFLPRDEDCENTFHSGADFLNMYLVKEVLDYDVSEQQVLIMDKMPNTQYTELLHRAFAPQHGVHRHHKYAGQKVMFKKMIFHLESPASLIFPETSTMGPQVCRDSTLFDAYRRHVLHAFDLLDVSPPPVPTASLILRHRTALKNVGRIIANEDEVIYTVQNLGNMMRANVLDLATMTYGDQLRAIRASNILVGVHGAGLSWILFAAEEAVLLEIHPSYREDRHFRHIAKLAGKDYLPMRSLVRETCQQTSDNVLVSISELTSALDGAVRLARNYDAGISECGLFCAPEILGMDERYIPLHEDESIIGRDKTPLLKGLDKTFPCP